MSEPTDKPTSEPITLESAPSVAIPTDRHSGLPTSPIAKSLAESALDFALAESHAGAREVGGNNSGPWVEKYLNALHPSRISHKLESWCVGFVLWCYIQACEIAGRSLPVRFTLSTSHLWAQLEKRGQVLRVANGEVVSEKAELIQPDPKPGDLAFWDFSGNGVPDHINMVVSYSEELGLATIGGNEGNEASGAPVEVKQRGLLAKLPKLYGFGWVEER